MSKMTRAFRHYTGCLKKIDIGFNYLPVGVIIDDYVGPLQHF